METFSGTLFIVSTPIGNLEDITFRAVRTLKEVDLVIAEDTRRTRPLLSHLGISKEVMSYFEYSSSGKVEKIISLLEQGQNLALVSDAGTPTLADPGARVVALCREKGIPVIPIPGPNAFLAALSVSGFPTDPLHFWGFLSPSGNKRRKVYHLMQTLEGSHCLYESPHKLLKHLKEWQEFFPEYYFCFGKEITKKFETFWVGPLQTVQEEIVNADHRGEWTVIFSKERLLKKE